jgi:large subunit ribosomal protein L17
MKHAVKKSHLNRSSGHRRALYKNLLAAVIEHGAVTTTPAKAKAVQGQLDRLINQAKTKSLAGLRQIDRVLNKRDLTARLTSVIVPAVGERKSGFSRLISLPPRRGDAALQARLELVDKLPTKETKKLGKKVGKKEIETSKPTEKITQTVPKDSAVPQMKPQPSMKTGMLRRKSGER